MNQESNEKRLIKWFMLTVSYDDYSIAKYTKLWGRTVLTCLLCMGKKIPISHFYVYFSYSGYFEI